MHLLPAASSAIRFHSQRDSIANYLFFLKENNWLLAHFGYQIDLFGPCEAGMAQSDQNWRMGIGSPQSRQKILNRRLTQINADKLITAEAPFESLRPSRVRRELIFCLSGDDDKQKLVYCGQ